MSWEENADKGKPGSKMSATAKPFVFNPAAREFVPGGVGGGGSAAPPQASVSAQDFQAPTAELQRVALDSAEPRAPSKGAEDDDEVEDENDPLWKVVLRLAEGNKAMAREMLNDPDALMDQYPEVREVIEATATEEVDMVEEPAAGDGVSQPEVPAKPEGSKPASKAPTPTAQGGKGATEDDDGSPDIGELQEEDPREHLNLVFIGHVDAGKSTMSGQILYLTGQVDKRTIERFEKEAKSLNRESWFLAFIMDINEEERAKGKTVEVGRAHFETETKRYTIMDAPGHKNYVPNMIAGAVQADVGILVISARRGEFETGFERGGQTREHALLAKTLGVKYLVVVINKMDDPTVKWAKERFDECVTKLKPFLKTCGYAVKKDVKFIPVSGLTGDNLLKEVSASACPWWTDLYLSGEHNTTEPTLITCLDALHIQGRDPAAPLRIPVLDRYHDRGTVALGKVESGSVKVGMKVMAMPTRNQYEVQGIWINDLGVRSAKPGENVKIKLLGAGVEDVQKGFVLCSPAQPCQAVTRFECQLALVDLPEHRPIFSPGYNAILHAHTTEEEVTVTELLAIENKKTGEIKKRPRFARQGDFITARMRTSREVCCEVFDGMPQLGRLTLRDEGKTIAIGKITRLPRAQDK